VTQRKPSEEFRGGFEAIVNRGTQPNFIPNRLGTPKSDKKATPESPSHHSRIKGAVHDGGAQRRSDHVPIAKDAPSTETIFKLAKFLEAMEA
jgi:hypothetical protein